MKNFYRLLLFCIAFSSSLFGKTIHLLMLGDDKSSDIKVSVNRDLTNFEKSFSYFTKISHIKLKAYTLTSQKGNLKVEKINEWIDKTQIQQQDVVIIYYSGHGFRTTKSPTVIPFGGLSGFKKVRGKILDFPELVTQLIKKKADLSIVLLDCCNNYYPEKRKHSAPTSNDTVEEEEFHTSFSLDEIKKKYVAKQIAQGFLELLNKKGVVIACAASPGEVARCRNGEAENEYYAKREDFTIGGLFTRIFLVHLARESNISAPCWEQILKKTQEDTVLESKQHAYHLFEDDNYQFHTPIYGIMLSEKKRNVNTYLNFFLRGMKSKEIFFDYMSEVNNGLNVEYIYLNPSI